MAVWLLEAIAALSRTLGGEIPPTSQLNATSVLPTKHCISTPAWIQREPCLCVTDSCVKLVLLSAYASASTDLYPYRLLLWRHPSKANRRYFDMQQQHN